MSARISLASRGSATDVCSLSRAGMLFWPTYRVVSVVSASGQQVRNHGIARLNKAHTICAYSLPSVVAQAPPTRLRLIG